MKKFVFPSYLFFNKKMAKELSPFIKKNSRVLDFGCGRGVLGHFIAKKPGVRVTGMDIRDGRKFDIPFTLYDGKKIPFPDNHFDAVLAAYVLHHTQNAESLLREIKRVCRGKIIIYEDTPENLMHKAFSCFHGRLFNVFFSVSSGCRFFSRSEWLRLFKKQRLELVYMKNVRMFDPTYLTKRTLFVLK